MFNSFRLFTSKSQWPYYCYFWFTKSFLIKWNASVAKICEVRIYFPCFYAYYFAWVYAHIVKIVDLEVR